MSYSKNSWWSVWVSWVYPAHCFRPTIKSCVLFQRWLPVGSRMGLIRRPIFFWKGNWVTIQAVCPISQPAPLVPQIPSRMCEQSCWIIFSIEEDTTFFNQQLLALRELLLVCSRCPVIRNASAIFLIAFLVHAFRILPLCIEVMRSLHVEHSSYKEKMDCWMQGFEGSSWCCADIVQLARHVAQRRKGQHHSCLGKSHAPCNFL